MSKLLEDMNMNEASEEVAVQLAAHGVIGKRVDEMESGFRMALNYMIQLAEKDQDEKRKTLLEGIKETTIPSYQKVPATCPGGRSSLQNPAKKEPTRIIATSCGRWWCFSS